MTETKPAPGWCLQRLWGRSFGVLRGFNVLVQLLRENQALLRFFRKETRALETTGAGCPRTAAPGVPAQGHFGAETQPGTGNRRGLSSGGLQLPAGTAHARQRSGSRRS